MAPIFMQNVDAVKRSLAERRDSNVLPIERLAKVIIPGALGIKPGEKVLMVTDVSSTEMTPENGPKTERMRILARWKTAAELAGGNASVLVHEETGSHGKALPEKGVLLAGSETTENVNVLDILRGAQVLVGIHSYSATGPLKMVATETGGRGFSMPTVNEDMEGVMSADHSEFPRISQRLKATLDQIEVVRLRFTIGQSVYPLQIDKTGVEVHISDGTALTPGLVGNYPGAEDYLVPNKMSGTGGYWPILSADGSELLVLKVVNGIIHLPGAKETDSIRDPMLRGVITDLKRMPGNTNFAELGFGLNPLARTGIGITVLEAEKALGVHLAYGQDSHFGGKVGKDTSDVHQDIVYARSDARIKVDAFALVGSNWEILTW